MKAIVALTESTINITSKGPKSKGPNYRGFRVGRDQALRKYPVKKKPTQSTGEIRHDSYTNRGWVQRHKEHLTFNKFKRDSSASKTRKWNHTIFHLTHSI